MNDRGQLEAEIQQLEEEANELRRRTNETGYITKMAEVNAKRAELDRMANEEIIIATTDEITSSMEVFTVGDMTFTLEQLAVDEDGAEILRSALKSTGKAQAQKFLDELSNQKSTYEMHLALKQDQVNILLADRDELQNDKAQLQMEKDDLAEKRDAAAQQLLEAQAEIARLSSHVDDLRKEIAVGATNTINVIDVTSEAELEAAAQRLRAKQEQAAAEKRAAAEAAKIPVYDVKEVFKSGPEGGTFKTFKIAETGEDGEIVWTNFNGKYRVMDEAEVKRFRAELEAAKADIPETEEPISSDLVVESPTIEAPQLPSEDAGRQLDGDSVETESVQDHDGGTVTRAEYEALVKRVSNVESALTLGNYNAA